ncbi:MAG: tetratricopeptide repeat protein, partial [Deltaproteobacteria bacterium]|nr:tetratricopeptide repeat protein [Deltaproteobacteria bacterium]
QRSDNKVRVNAQLIDAASGQHLWAERYDRDLKDLFALQDEITMKIVTALHVKLTGHERAKIMAEGTGNLDAYLKLMKGFATLRSSSPENIMKTKKIAEEVIAMDPDYPKGYLLLAFAFIRDAWHKKGISTEASLGRAFELATKALSMDDSLIGGYLVLGNIYLLRKQHDKAIAELEKAAALNPNAFEIIAELGKVLLWSGRPREAIRLFKRAMRLNPIDAHYYELRLAKGYRMVEEYEKAIPVFEKIVKKEPDRIWVHLELIACYRALGRNKQADVHVAEVLKKKPGFSIGKFVDNLPYKDPEMKSRFTALLREGGLPD